MSVEDRTPYDPWVVLRILLTLSLENKQKRMISYGFGMFSYFMTNRPD